MTTADLLARIAAERKISLAQLAAYMGVSTSAMHRWTHGQGQPDPRYCWKIAELAGMPVEEVMRIAGHLPPAESMPERSAIDPQVKEALDRMSPEEQRAFALPAIELAEALLRSAREQGE